MENVFFNPRYYRDIIVDNVRVNEEKLRNFDGKSFACVFFTKFCNAGCPFCFFKSDTRKDGNPQEQFEFSRDGFEKFIEFINSSNNGYLLISGGGEPFEKIEYIYESIERVNTERIVIVTSGIWAKDYENAKKIIFDLNEKLKGRNDNLKVVLRLSLDKFHYKQLGFDLVKNIVSVFREYFKNDSQFELQIHTMIGDETVNNVVERLENAKLINASEKRISDNNSVIKIVPERQYIKFDDDYEIKVGLAKIFYPNLKANLNRKELYERALNVFDEDIIYSEYNNPSVVTNFNKQLGYDFWINYNGNITTWGNQQLNHLNNLYVDTYEKIISDLRNNVISYSFIDKGYVYRENIINEVNPRAVLRSKVVNIRDYSGALLLEEHKTSLYYAIRIINEYLKEGILTAENLLNLPLELVKTILMPKEDVKKLFRDSNYSIVDQYMNEEHSYEEWLDILTLIKLGHYDVSQDKINLAISYFNKTFGFTFNSIDDINVCDDKQYSRLIERITFMKKEAKEYCRKVNGEVNGEKIKRIY